MKRVICLGAVFLSASLLSGCGCTDDVVTQVPAPDGILTATLFVRHCGDTSGQISTVNLHRTADTFGDDRGTVLMMEGKYDITMSWTDPKTLTIRCPTCPREVVSRQTTVLGGTNVEYELGTGLVAVARREPGPTLFIQVVGKSWVPLPGMGVSIQRMESCAAAEPVPNGEPRLRDTNRTGVAQIDVGLPGDYLITTTAENVVQPASRCVHLTELAPGDDNPIVQMQVEVTSRPRAAKGGR
jgi:hypothetical protein